jgi:hypothetical protein
MTDLLERLRQANPVPTCETPDIDDVWRRLEQDKPRTDRAWFPSLRRGDGRRGGFAWLTLALAAVPVAAVILVVLASRSSPPRSESGESTTSVVHRLFPTGGVSLPAGSVVIASGHSPVATPYILAAVPNKCPTRRGRAWAQLPIRLGYGGAFSGPCGDGLNLTTNPCPGGNWSNGENTFNSTVSTRVHTIRLITQNRQTINAPVYQLPTSVAHDVGEYLLFVPNRAIRRGGTLQSVASNGHVLQSKQLAPGGGGCS